MTFSSAPGRNSPVSNDKGAALNIEISLAIVMHKDDYSDETNASARLGQLHRQNLRTMEEAASAKKNRQPARPHPPDKVHRDPATAGTRVGQPGLEFAGDA
jgi:hypothetical protein